MLCCVRVCECVESAYILNGLYFNCHVRDSNNSISVRIFADLFMLMTACVRVNCAYTIQKCNTMKICTVKSHTHTHTTHKQTNISFSNHTTQNNRFLSIQLSILFRFRFITSKQTIKPSQHLFGQIFKTLNCSPILEVVISLALTHSKVPEFVRLAEIQLKISLPALIQSYVELGKFFDY